LSGNFVHLVAVNLRTRAAIFDNDTILPITKLIDHFGEDTEVIDHAKVFVAGGEASGWIVVELSAIPLLQPVN